MRLECQLAPYKPLPETLFNSYFVDFADFCFSISCLF